MPAVESTPIDRRQLGRYDTPRPLSQAVVDWAIRSAKDEIFEPSSGSGVFVKSALHRLTQLRCPHPQAQVWACDIDATACTETLRETGLNPEHIWHGDFLSFTNSTGARGRKFDCIVGNPPYVSLHRMQQKQREHAYAVASRVGLHLDRKASLWAYFVAAALHALRDAGRLAMLLPEAALHTDYARKLIRRRQRSLYAMLASEHS